MGSKGQGPGLVIEPVFRTEGAEGSFVLAPKGPDGIEAVVFREELADLVGAADFVEEAYPVAHLKRFSIRIELNNGLHHMKLDLCDAGSIIVRKEELDALHQLSFQTS